MKLKLATYRKRYGMTQTMLAKHLGMSYQSISKWETGVSLPDLETMMKIANLFEVTIDELIDQSQFKPKKSTQNWGEQLEYLETTRRDLWNDDYLEFLIQKVWCFKTPIHILDIGCGYGYLGIKLLPLLPEGSTYTGVDINRTLLEKAEVIFSNTHFDTTFVHMDIYEYEGDKKYDVAICQAVLRHLYEPEEVLKLMINAVKKGGKVIAVEVNRMIEACGYYHSKMDYHPWHTLDIFKHLWMNERSKNKRDFGIGIKLPSMMYQLGLKNIQCRLNDKVMTGNEDYLKKHLIAIKNWSFEDRTDYLNTFKIRLINEGASRDEVDAFSQWYNKNIEVLMEMNSNDCVTFFRGLMITFGDKA